MVTKKVVVTGLGVLNCCGKNVNEYWKSLLEGKSGISLIENFDASDLPSRIAGEIKNYDPNDYVDKKIVKRTDKFIHYSLTAAYEAVKDAGLDNENANIDKNRVGVIFGSGIGGIEIFYDTSVAHSAGGWKKVSPFFIPSLITNMAGGMIALEYGFRGVNYSISTACASSSHSMIEACHSIQRGECDIVVTGGSEAPITAIGFSGFCAARALSTRNDAPEKASRPFDKGRDGFVMSEGAGCIVLESEESALRRGAKIYAEFVGGGMSCDAYHMTAPCEDGSGAALAMQNALTNCGLKAEQINLVNMHGTSTQLGDIAETLAVKKVFGEYARKLKLQSTKSMVGHLIGAAGVSEAIAVIKSIETKRTHGTMNLEEPDEQCDLDYLANKAVDMDIQYAISNSFGFGGQNASIVLGQYNKK